MPNDLLQVMLMLMIEGVVAGGAGAVRERVRLPQGEANVV